MTKKFEINPKQWMYAMKTAPKQKQAGYSLIIIGAILILISFIWILFSM